MRRRLCWLALGFELTAQPSGRERHHPPRHIHELEATGPAPRVAHHGGDGRGAISGTVWQRGCGAVEVILSEKIPIIDRSTNNNTYPSRWESWNEPDHGCNSDRKMDSEIDCDQAGWLGYWDACVDGLQDGSPEVHMILGGPGTGGDTQNTAGNGTWVLSALVQHLEARKRATGRYAVAYQRCPPWRDDRLPCPPPPRRKLQFNRRPHHRRSHQAAQRRTGKHRADGQRRG